MTETSPTPDSSSNNRTCLRLPRPYRVQARELVFPIAKSPLFEADCNDISKGGLCVESATPLPVGARLHISVHVPLLNKFSPAFFKVYENDADQHFEAIADVAWVKQRGASYLLGLQFINVDEDTCKAIEKLVEDAFRTMGCGR